MASLANPVVFPLGGDVTTVSEANAFSLSPTKPVHAETCDRLISGIPETSFIVTGQYIVPYSFNKTSFDLSITVPGSKIDVLVTRQSLNGELNSNNFSFIPSQTKSIVYLDLGLGKNYISAVDSSGNKLHIIVVATHYATILCANAREIFNHTQVILDEQTNAIYSKVSTRLAEPLISFSDLLPDVRSQQVLATKLAVKSMVSNPGNSKGVTDLVKSLTLNTPIYIQNTNDSNMFEPVVYPLFNDPEHFGGVDIHTWPANTCLTTWIAFNKFLMNLGFKIVSISEREVVFEDENHTRQSHQFNFLDSECSLTDLILSKSCFDNINISLQITDALYITFCAAQYTFDICINTGNLLGQNFPTFDSRLDTLIYVDGITVTGTKQVQVNSATFSVSDVGNRLEVLSGVDAGVYTIDTYVNPTTVTVVRGSNFTGSVFISTKLTRFNPYVLEATSTEATQIVATKQIVVPVTGYFKVSDVGRLITVVSGPNAGTYPIATFIDDRHVTVTRGSNFVADTSRVYLANYASDFTTVDPGADGYLGTCAVRILWDSIEKTHATGTTVVGTANITTSTAFFAIGDVGKTITVETDVDAGSYLITAFNSSTSVTTDRTPNFAGSSPVQIHVSDPNGENTLDSYGAIPGLYFASEFPYIRNAAVTSTTAATRVVVLSGIDLLAKGVNSGEIITFLGTSNALLNGRSFIVESVLSATTLRVREPLLSSAGGTANFTHTCVYHGYRTGLVSLESANVPLDATAAGNGGAWGSLVGHLDGSITV